MNDWDRGNDRNFAPGYGSVHPAAGYPAGYPQDMQTGFPKKKKWLAGLLAFFVPGLGHFYLGQMIKGITVMLLIAFDIGAIVFAATQIQEALIIVLLSLMLPILYFYSLFDAVQSTDVVNHRRRYPDWQAQMFAPRPEYAPAPDAPQHPNGMPSSVPPGLEPEPPQGLPRQVNATGVMVLAAVVIVLILVMGMGWSGWVFRSSGSMAGAFVLICAGIGLWIWELRGDRGRKG